MGKKKNLSKTQPPARLLDIDAPQTPSAQTSSTPQWMDQLLHGYIPYLLIVLCGVLLYANTFRHEFALDDEMIIVSNDYVQKGVAGIPEIMTTDMFDSYNKANKAEAGLSGGRFRPLSMISFALEQEFIGTYPEGMPDNAWDLNKNGKGDAFEDANGDGRFTLYDAKIKGMGMRHVNNVLLYALSICLLFYFLRRWVFPAYPLLALLTVLLFLVHPVHTEVVANVKSRDEILALLFIGLTLIVGMRYIAAKKSRDLVLTLVCFFLALLSKEFGVILLVLFPVAVWVLPGITERKIPLAVFAGMVLVFGIYFAMRQQTMGGVQEVPELLNNPYLKASASEALATKIYIHLRYFLLMLFPETLSCDYNYQAIPYRRFSDPEVWISILLLASLATGIVVSFKRKSKFLFALLLLVLPLLLVNNLIFNVGATMGERLIYLSSFGFCLLLIMGFEVLINQTRWKQLWTIAILAPVMLVFAIKTWSRNPDWKNNTTLYQSDIKKYPGSAFLNGNLLAIYGELAEEPGRAAQRQQLLDTAAYYGYQALQWHPEYNVALLNMGKVMAARNKNDSMAYFFNRLLQRAPQNQEVAQAIDQAAGTHYNRGVEFLKQEQLDAAFAEMQTAHQIKPRDHRPLYFLGQIRLRQHQPDEARRYWKQGLQFAPNDGMLRKALMDSGGLE